MVIYKSLFILFIMSTSATLNGMDTKDKDIAPKKPSQTDGIRRQRRSLSGSGQYLIQHSEHPFLSPISELTSHDVSANPPPVKNITDSNFSPKRRSSSLSKRSPKSESPEKKDLEQLAKSFTQLNVSDPAFNIPPIETVTDSDSKKRILKRRSQSRSPEKKGPEPLEKSFAEVRPTQSEPQLPVLIISEIPTTADTIKKKSSSDDAVKKKSSSEDALPKKISSGKLTLSQSFRDSVKKKRSSLQRKKSRSQEMIRPNADALAKKRLSWSTPVSSDILPQLAPLQKTIPDNTPHIPLPDNKPSLIDAVRRHDHGQIKTLLNDKNYDPNQEKDEFGNTAFLIVFAGNDNISKQLFLGNQKVNPLVRNHQGQMASELLEKPQDLESPKMQDYINWRRKLFAWQFVETQIRKYAMGSLIRKAHDNATIDQNALDAIIQIIKAKLTKDDEQQTGDREMPRSAAELPPYATDDFIAARFYAYFNENPQQK